MIQQVKAFNNFARNSENLEFKSRTNRYNPVVVALHHCSQQLTEFSSLVHDTEPVMLMFQLVDSKVKLKDFTWLPTDMNKIQSVSGHSKKLRARSHISKRVRAEYTDRAS